MTATATILPGVWHCTTCKTRYRFRHTRGVMSREPRDLPDPICPRCGGTIEAANDAARQTEEHVRHEAAYWERLIAEDAEAL